MRWTTIAIVLLTATGALCAEVDVDGLAKRIVASARTDKGFCVDLGCGDGRLAAAVLKHSAFYVHAIESDDARVAAARKTLSATGLYGNRTSVEKGSLACLPYPDYCANLIIRGDSVSGAQADLSWTEVVRVLRVGGLALIGRPAGVAGPSAEALKRQLKAAGVKDFDVVEDEGVWVTIRRSRPAGTGDWSHGGNGSADGNACVDDERVKAPFQTLWINGPRRFTQFGLPLLSNGRVLLRHGGITYEGRYTPPKRPDLVQAFDAYNGTLLWQRRMPEREGEGFVAVGDLVFAESGQILYGLSAADGKARWRLPASSVAGMKDWAGYACADGVLVATLFDTLRDANRPKRNRPRKALVGMEPATGKIAWKITPDASIGRVVCGPGRVFYGDSVKRIKAADIATGREIWSVDGNANGMRYHDGRLYTDAGVHSATDGTLLARRRFRGVLVGNRAYAGGFKGLSAVNLANGQRVPTLKIPHDPFCPKTGIPAGCSYMYGRCVMSTASTHCFFYTAGGTVIGDLTRGELFPTEAFRSNCRTGVIAGNGLVYNSPSGCKCALAVRGGVALLPVDEAFYRAKASHTPQLEKGPAFDEKPGAKDAPDAWPTLRHDAARSNVTGGKIRTRLKAVWTSNPAGAITPPAVADGMVFVGSKNHSVYALNAADGKVRWRYITGGGIPVTPTVWRGRVFVGSMDGWVYCLRAGDGKLIWRFRGGPHERKMLFFGRPQSLWPIGGGVIVENGVANFYAGYCSHDRVFVYALDAATGGVIWCNERLGRAMDVTGPKGGVSPWGVSPTGAIAASRDILYVPHGMVIPAGLRRSDGRLLWWNWRGDSAERSNIEVQGIGGPNLSVTDRLVFIGGPNAMTGSAQPFTAIDARTGRFWGADDPRLFARAGRDKTGKSVVIKKSMFGTKPIRLGYGIAPVVVDGGIFIFGYRGGFRDLGKVLETQFAPVEGGTGKWPNPVPSGTLVVTSEKVLVAGRGRVGILARADGKPLGRAGFRSQGSVLPDGLAVAGGKVFIATDAGEIICLSSDGS